MLLVSAEVGPFKSINNPQVVDIGPTVTVLVGMNEAGKTVFLQALEKSADALAVAGFDHISDYPRKALSAYMKKHETHAEAVTKLTYQLSDDEVAKLNSSLKTNLPKGFQFTVTKSYNNNLTISIHIEEEPVLKALLASSSLSSDALMAAKESTSLREIPAKLSGVSLTPQDDEFLAVIKKRIDSAGASWASVLGYEVWNHLRAEIPKFLYFSDYDLLPDKMNLADLAGRVEQAKHDPKALQPKHRAVLALLRMADISISEFTTSSGYEPLKAKIEAVSISITDQIMRFWRQNEDLDVEVDITVDPKDEPPFNNGPNLYLRIKNRRHRGVTTPFQQRSRGFIWFFSFLVWFDSVQHQLDAGKQPAERDLILLLDEPALALHALAQADFLTYIDDLAQRHQVLYTTHSPFMVHTDRLDQVRVVEDKPSEGTVISSNVGGADPKTIFPLQAALGWTIAQNLFISKKNLLVEGPSDLLFLKVVSSLLEASGGHGLSDGITIVPTGGLDKVVTFVSLLGANGLKLAVLHDFHGSEDQKLLDLVKHKIISPKQILNASQFRDISALGTNGRDSDIEDLLSPSIYLDAFNSAYAKQLGGAKLVETDLPVGDRVLDRIDRHIVSKGIKLRPSGGFNHYLPAVEFAKNPGPLDPDTLKRFEALFEAVNKRF